MGCRAFFTDIEEGEYEARRHNVWDEEKPSDDALRFYGAARVAAHDAFHRRCAPFGGRRLLDVGCGLGFFLERARDAGWEAWGCEPAPAWAELAAHRNGWDRVLRGRIEDPELDAMRFDMITAWDVIEHVFDPVRFLRRIRELLAPGGRVFLRTPNLSYVLPVYRVRRRLGHDVSLGPINHVVYFDSSTIRRALAQAGLRPERWLALPPPQVATFRVAPGERHAPRRSLTVTAKNAWAGSMDALAGATGGRVVLASDLDVIAHRSEDGDAITRGAGFGAR